MREKERLVKGKKERGRKTKHLAIEGSGREGVRGEGSVWEKKV